MGRMITLQHGNSTFTYRVAAVIIDQNRVLLHHAEQENCWSLPGGQVDFWEPAAQALRRVLREEMGAEVAIDRLLWVVENFSTHQGGRRHELGLYFLVHLPLTAGQLRDASVFEGQHPALTLIFRWFSIESSSLEALTLNPEFLRDSLLSLPDQVVHITGIHY